MAEADRLAIAAGPFDGMALMRRAGAAVAAVVLERYPAASPVHVLCGPGNNGGDGYVVGAAAAEAGVDVAVWRADAPRAGSDAAMAAAECPVAAAAACRISPRARARSSSMRCSGPACRSRSEDAYAAAIEADRGVGRCGGRGRSAERHFGRERRGARDAPFKAEHDRHLLPQEAGTSALSRARALRRDDRRRHRHCAGCARRRSGRPASRTRRRSGATRFRGRPPTPTNMRAAMSASFPAVRPSTGAARLSAMAAARAGAGAVTAAVAGQCACRQCRASDLDHPAQGRLDGGRAGVPAPSASRRRWSSGRGLARTRRSATSRSS